MSTEKKAKAFLAEKNPVTDLLNKVMRDVRTWEEGKVPIVETRDLRPDLEYDPRILSIIKTKLQEAILFSLLLYPNKVQEIEETV